MRHLMRATPAGKPRFRGMAMLMVMIALVICMVLVTGFLSTQGTANGIAKNEGEYIRAQRAAEDGANMCLWLVKNRSSWRSNMNPGTWLNNYQIGSGFVTVTAVDAGNNASFMTDPTKAVVFTSTGTFNNRTAKLRLTAQPTGAGGVFGDGCFSSGQVKLEGNAVADSYNSKYGNYGFFNSNWNALLGTTSTSNGAFTLADNASVYGSVYSAPGVVLSLLFSLGLNTSGPFATPSADEIRTPGQVIAPNPTGLVTRLAYTGSGNGTAGPLPGKIPSVTLVKGSGATNIVFSNSGLYKVAGNVTMPDGCSISVSANKAVVLEVDGNFSCGSGGISLGNGATCVIYYVGSFTADGSTLGSSSSNTSGLTILGLKNSAGATGQMDLKGSTKLYGVVFAPQSAVVVEENAQVYGGIVSATMDVKDSGKLHWDESLPTRVLTQVTSGSAAPALPVYQLTYLWNQ